MTMAISARYHNRYLFDYGREELSRCMERLRGQADLYGSGGPHLRRRMRIRALFRKSVV